MPGGACGGTLAEDTLYSVFEAVVTVWPGFIALLNMLNSEGEILFSLSHSLLPCGLCTIGSHF